MTDSNVTIEKLLEKQKENYKNANLSLIQRAYDYANKHHGGQLRKSGEPYMIHPLNVAYKSAVSFELAICLSLVKYFKVLIL